MTNPTRKRVVTLDDLNVLNQNAAYARQKGEEASAAAQQADTARQNLEALGGDTQAAGQQATQAAQAATLAKNSATAAALQASQAAGDAVTAAELAEGAAGSANQAAGAATTAAQRVTDAVLDLSGLKDATAQRGATAQAQGDYAMSRITEALALASSGAANAYATRAEVPSAAGTYLVLSEAALVRRAAQGGALTDLFAFGRPHATLNALASTLTAGRDVPWRTLAPASLTTLTLPNPYPDPGSADVVHPGIVHVPTGWNGYRYWMVYEPYNNTNNQYENPVVVCSNAPDGPWIVPAGAPAPIYGPPPGAGAYCSDADPFIDPTDDGLVIVFRATGSTWNQGGSADSFLWSKSLDGATWTAPAFLANPALRYVSPSYVFRGDHWLMFATEIDSSGPLNTYVFRAARWQDCWAAPRTAITPNTAPDGNKIWHMKPTPVGDRLVFSASTIGGSGGPLWLAESSDPRGVEWVWASEPVLASGGYRSQVLAVDTPDGPRLDFWVGTSGPNWRIKYGRSAPIARADATAALAQAAAVSSSIKTLGLAPTLVYDSFARPDGAMDAPDVGNAWTDFAGGAPTAFTRVGGRVRATAATNSRIVLDAGRADVRVTGDLNREGSSDQMWLALRVQDNNNLLRFGISGATWAIQKIVGAVATPLTLTGAPPAGSGIRRVVATLSGQAVTVTLDGVTVYAGTIPEFVTATRFGYQATTVNPSFGPLLIESLDNTTSTFPRRIGLPDATARATAAAAQSAADTATTWAALERAERGRAPFTSGDGFDRADAATLGTAPYGGAWTDLTPGFGVTGRQAVAAVSPSRAALTLPSANQTVEVTVPTATASAWLILRAENGANYLRFGANGGVLRLETITNSNITATTSSTVALAAGQRWRVACLGDQITAYVNGVQVLTATVSTYNTQTKFGVQGNVGVAFDDWFSRPS